MKYSKHNNMVRLGLILTLVISLSVGCLPDRSGKSLDGDETTQNDSTQASDKSGTSGSGEQVSGGSEVVPVETMKLTKSKISETVYTYGYLETNDTYVVTPYGSGIVDEIMVSVGEYVEAGELLYQLEAEDLALSEERDMLQQNSSVTSAKNNKDSLELTLTQRESDVAGTQLSLTNAKKTYEDTVVLFESDIVSQSELDASKNSLEQTQISYDQAVLNLESTQLSYEASKNSYNEAVTNYELTKKDYDGREGDLFVSAPISGLVTDISVQEDMMNSGNLGITIVDDAYMVLNINIMEKYIHDIEEGQSVDLVLEYENKSIIGTVTDISLTGQSGYYPVEITIDNSDKTLVTGMFTEGYINTNIKSDILKVEKTTLVQDISGHNFLYVVNDKTEKAIKVSVEKGIEEGDFVEIIGSINPGDEIIVIGQDYIVDGQSITIVN